MSAARTARLVGPARIIDVQAACQRDRHYLLSVADLRQHEERYGPIAPGDVALVRTGFGRHYPDLARDLASDARGTAEELSGGTGGPCRIIAILP